ncbi:MAG: cohesin domain-containing protein, partial [Candidatus Omnitrophica bacterium]|nr:cohesin domain-containing protein [Candidatus Omnitrophota bacterium]
MGKNSVLLLLFLLGALTIPNNVFALTAEAGSISASAGQEIGIPISISGNTENIIGIDLVLEYDAALLEALQPARGTLTENPVNWAMVANISQPGAVRIALYVVSANAYLPAGSSGVIAQARFRVKSSVSAGQSCRLMLSRAEFNSISATTTNGLFTVTAGANHPPELEAIGNKELLAGVAYTFNVNARDLDHDALTISCTGLPGGASFVPFTGTPAAGYDRTYIFSWASPVSGSYLLTFVVDDQRGGRDSESITLTVNPPPIQSYTITASAGPSGSINPSGTIAVNRATNQAFTVTANTGYVINEILVDGIAVSLGGERSNYTYNFIDVTSNHTISASFKQIAHFTYTITASVLGKGGTISPAGVVNLAQGANQTFTIIPDSGYRINRVSVDKLPVVLSAKNTYTFTNVTSNHIIMVEFAVSQNFTLTLNALNGTIIKNPDRASYASGDIVTLTAESNSGYRFDSWSEDLTGNTNPASITMDGNKTVTANFIPIPQAPSFTTQPVDQIITRPAEATFTVAASGIPTPTYQWQKSKDSGVSWQDIAGATGSSYATPPTTDADADTQFRCVATNSAGTAISNVASLRLNPIISVVSNAGGRISVGEDFEHSAPPLGGRLVIPWSANTNVFIIPEAGYVINQVLVNGNPRELTDNKVILSSITNDITVSVTFIPVYTITATAGEGGSINPAGATTVNSGADLTITITADAHYEIADVLVDGKSMGRISTYTFSNVNSHHTISASFSYLTYIITASAGANGNISPAGRVEVREGASQTFVISAAAHYKIQDISVDGVSAGALASYTFSNVTRNHTIAANFIPERYQLRIEGGSGSGEYAYGQTVMVYPTLATDDYLFVRWSGDVPAGQSASNPLSIIMDSDKTIRAEYNNRPV